MQIVEIEEPGSSSTKQEFVVGIDFGTTNSLVSISEGCIPRVIGLDNGRDILPSIISVNNGVVMVGNRYNKNSITSIKRYLAKSSEEILSDKLLASQSDSMNLSSETPKIQVGDKFITLTEAASEIFKYLSMNANREMEIEIKKAVISVPAHFDDNARGQVMLAAKIAGLDVIRLISEPTAAAYAYGLNKQKEGAYLVYDLGGGTFDVSILNMMAGVLQVVSTDGDNMLGGDDIDFLIAQHISTVYKVDCNNDLIALAKKQKEELSSKQDSVMGFREKRIILTKSDFEKIIDPLLKKTIKIAKNALHEANDIDLDGIILVGGSTRIPMIKEALKKSFNVEVFDDLDPDKIVAMGAAMQGENLSSQSNALLIDVVPLSLGIELYGSMVEKVIMRNTAIPFSITKEFTTHVDNQTGISFNIVQGEREMSYDCRSLANFELSGLKPQKAGKVRVEVIFSIDADGILSVSACDKNNGSLQSITLKPSYGVSEDDIISDIKTSYENAEEDYDLRLLSETKSQAESLVTGLEVSIKETPDILDKDQYNKMYDSIETLKISLKNDNRDDIIIAMNKLNKHAGDFIQKHLDKGVDAHLKGRHIDEIKIK